MKCIHKTLAICSAILVSVCLAETGEEFPIGQICEGGVELPAWQTEYAAGHFDTRLWPEAIIQKVEVDHLRFLANAPDTTAEDREMFLEVVHEWEKTHSKDGQALSYNMPIPTT